MDLWSLKPGHKLRIREGAEAEVLSEDEEMRRGAGDALP